MYPSLMSIRPQRSERFEHGAEFVGRIINV